MLSSCAANGKRVAAPADIYARLPAQGGEQALVERRPLDGVAAVFRHGAWQIVSHRDHAPGLEPDGILTQEMKRAREQPGADEQHEAQRELRDDERTMPAEAAAAWRRRAPAIPQRLFQIRPGAVPRGQEATEEAGYERDADAEHEHARIDADGVQPRQMRGGASSTSACTPAMASGTPRQAPSSASTQDSIRIARASRPRLAPNAARSACSRVRAMDWPSVRQATLAQAMRSTQPTAAKTASSMGRAGPTISVTSGTAVGAPAAVRVRKALLVEPRQAIQFGVRLFEVDPLVEPGDGVEQARRPIEVRRIEAQRNPEVGGFSVRQRLLPSTDVLQTRRQDLDDDKRTAREVDGVADDSRDPHRAASARYGRSG